MLFIKTFIRTNKIADFGSHLKVGTGPHHATSQPKPIYIILQQKTFHYPSNHLNVFMQKLLGIQFDDSIIFWRRFLLFYLQGVTANSCK